MSFDPFNNKDAQAILKKICKSKSLGGLKRPLSSAKKLDWIKSSQLCAECLAIGELIAVGRGNAGKVEPPVAAEKWLSVLAASLDDDLAELARLVVDLVRSKSVDWNIAYEMGGYPEWTAYCRGLSNRLKKPARAAKKKRTTKNPAKEALKYLRNKLCDVERQEKGDVLELRCFEKNQITDDDLLHIAELNKLEVLVLHHQRVTDDGLAHLSSLKQLKELRTVGCDIKGHGYHNLKLPKLQRLSFEKKGVNVAIANCQHLKGLHKVDLRASDLSDKGLEQLATFKSLQSIWLDRCAKFKGTGFNKLKSLKKLNKVQAQEIKFSGPGWKALCGLTSLRHLDIGSAKIPLPDVAQLANLKKLEELNLSDTKVTDKHLEFLGRMKKLTTLKLSRNKKVTDETLQVVSKLPALKELELARTSLSEGAFDILKGMNQITHLSLYECGISRENQKKLERHCKANAKKMS